MNWKKDWEKQYKRNRKVTKGTEPWHKNSSFFGIAAAAWCATLAVACEFIWDQIVCLPHNRIKDGYTILLLGPLVFTWWILSLSLFIIPLAILGLLLIPVGLWTIIFEAPAAALMGDFEKPKPQKISKETGGSK